MFEYTHENHYQFGWYNTLFNTPNEKKEYHNYQWKIGAKQNNSISLNFYNSCIKTAQYIWSICDDPFVMVCLSGGLDSEITLRSFLEAKIPVKVAIMKFKYNLNAFDIKYAIKFCEQNNVEYFTFELDAIEFITEKSTWYINQYKIMSPQKPFHLWLVDQFDEFPVLGEGDGALYSVDPFFENKIYWDIVPDTTTCLRHLIHSNRSGAPIFFMYTPEQVDAYLNDPIIKIWYNHNKSMKIHNARKLKSLIYEMHFPKLTPRVMKTGFENFERLDHDVIRPDLEKKHLKYNSPITVSKEELLNYLNGSLKIFKTSENRNYRWEDRMKTYEYNQK